MMSMPTASRPLKSAAVRGSSVPSCATATSPRRISRPPRCATTSCVEVGRLVETALQADGALVERAVQPADRRGEVLRLQRLHDLADADAGRLQRLRLELDGHLALDAADDADLGDAGDAAQLRVTPGIDEAGELGPVSVFDVSASGTIGKSFGSKRVRIGSSISGGRSLRICEMASRMSCVASCRFFAKWNSTVMTPKLSSELDWIFLTPLIAEICSSIGSTTSRSTVSGEAPG